ncbi:PLDc N-terminal domain-containing protein [uncultured Streptococcus sp.]|uniref:PLDc N-terminal domain-containing protein n=1 Tax=uncultured Streptococcus sp. TaxID=83427 RepID=UPI001A5EC650|nr:PLDc N-terminal domain-containing protein [uncultured Streptococcus sp.]VTY27247.1 Uncharacterised protein [uncultured Streptococcus sp.]
MLESISSLVGVSKDLFMILFPIFVLHFLMIIISCIDLFRNYKRKSEFLWILAIISVTIFGPILYLSVGKNFRKDN